MRRAYIEKKFRAESLRIIEVANSIIEDYEADGMKLTLRQLYYQFVAKHGLPNTMKSYDNLGELISNARLAGLVSWDAIEDRTRALEKLSTWGSPNDILRACAHSYKTDFWEDQDNYIEVWVEKEALAGVVERACETYRVPHFSCRGYASQSAVYEAGLRIANRIREGKEVHILHLGDHDPSGLDMTRDNTERLKMFIEGNNAYVNQFRLHRLALNMDQVEKYEPPPNPAKKTDIRYEGYAARHGDESWELDALDPKILIGMINDKVKTLVDHDQWKKSEKSEKKQILGLEELADTYEAE